MKFAPTLAAALLVAAPLHAAVLETEAHTFPVSKSHRVRIEFPVGELRVVPRDGSNVRFELRVRCRSHNEARCAELANRLRLDSDDTGGTLHLKLDNYPKWNNKGFTVMGVLHVPPALALKVEMGVGQLEIAGLEGDLDADLGVGEADIRASRARAGSVRVSAGIGDASIRGGGASAERHGFIGSSASWSGGSGRAEVRLNVGVGEATVRLD